MQLGCEAEKKRRSKYLFSPFNLKIGSTAIELLKISINA